MNRFQLAGYGSSLLFRCILAARRLGPNRRCYSLGSAQGRRHAVGHVYVINLDHEAERWSRMQRELRGIVDRCGLPLLNRSSRLSAVDARVFAAHQLRGTVDPVYSLREQLYVEPQPLVPTDRFDLDDPIEMTRQEVAVALSHIEAWKRVASGSHDYVLILEDDVWFHWQFARSMDMVWTDVEARRDTSTLFDLLYLSFDEARGGAEKRQLSRVVFEPFRGLWFLSGYVLSRRGATRLLKTLPVRGPVDLWMNHRFSELDVVAASKPVISQRPDLRSSNSYSVLPTLSRIGLLTREHRGHCPLRPGITPVFAVGPKGSGTTALAMALSMLGYRCCSDLDRLPEQERSRLLARGRGRIFNAYVNVGCVESRLTDLMRVYPEAKFVVLAGDQGESATTADAVPLNQTLQVTDSLLVLDAHGRDPWKQLCEFLRCAPPVSGFPSMADVGQRTLDEARRREPPIASRAQHLRFDPSPWTVPRRRDWEGLRCRREHNMHFCKPSPLIVDIVQDLDEAVWQARRDTFPSNLALCTPRNVSRQRGVGTLISVRKEDVGVRAYTAGALSTPQTFLYGRFEVVVRPAAAPGVVTGVFLHRNSPRQEIDIELLGRDPNRLLTNVYFNPGDAGARLDYGFRGTPVLVDLGFDASLDFHSYAIDWSPDAIRWFVDGECVHERFDWDPTPVPHLPMQFHINIWPCRSRALAGRIRRGGLPAISCVRSVRLEPAETHDASRPPEVRNRQK